VITSVALIPGHDKVDPCDGTDRFFNSRIVLRVRLEFDDDQNLEATFQAKRSMQEVAVPQFRSTRVRIVILETQPPPSGPFGRDVTPISEIEVRGVR
jgi:hypothetical protein